MLVKFTNNLAFLLKHNKGMEFKKLTREQLYNLVWSKPMTAVAKEFGYSDNALRKKCVKHNIPMPERGYWSKLKFNKAVKKTRLPKSSEEFEDSIILNPNENYDHDYKLTLSKLINLKKEILNTKSLNLKVPDKLKNPDILIIKAKENLKLKKPSMRAGKTGLLVTSEGILSIEVSRTSVPRALRFMDTLIKALIKRGHQIEVDYKTSVVIKDVKIEIRFREILKVVTMQRGGYEIREHVPSGEVSFKIDGFHGKEWRSTKTEILEDKIPAIIAKIELIAEEENDRNIQYKLRQEQLEIIEKQRKELQRLKDKELKSLKRLLSASTRLHKAQYIRSYIAQFKEKALKGNVLNDEKREWLEWAKEKADWYDPFIEKEVELLEDVDRDTLEYKIENDRNKYFLNKF